VIVSYCDTLPPEDIKVVVGDNLSCHLSPFVTELCEQKNIKFIFLPENSTNIMQPLDVSVFRAMKGRWGDLLRDWKDFGTEEFATIPKSSFPGLLARLLDKDYSNSIISGFAATGLFPFDPERVLRKFPEDAGPTSTAVETALLNRLSDMRYNPGQTKRAQRPSKKDKLPAGESYSCAGPSNPRGAGDAEEEEDENSDSDSSNSYKSSSSSGEEDESSEEEEGGSDRDKSDTDEDERARDEERSENVRKIIKRLEKPLKKLAQSRAGRSRQQEENEDDVEEGYPPGVYVAVVYDEDWWVGEVRDKECEPDADPDEDFLFVNFMEKGKQLRWPEKLDMLNVPKRDILCMVRPPTITVGCSSSRAVSFQLSSSDQKNVVALFNAHKAYYFTTVKLTVPVPVLNVVISFLNPLNFNRTVILFFFLREQQNLST